MASPVSTAWIRSWPASSSTSGMVSRSEEHTSELQSQFHLVCRLLLEKKNKVERDPILQSNNHVVPPVIIVIPHGTSQGFNWIVETLARGNFAEHSPSDITIYVSATST